MMLLLDLPISFAMPAPKSISLAARLRRVKLFLTDVDGVMPPRPGGTPENSPAFQRREQTDGNRVPKGRLIGCAATQVFNRPFGTCRGFRTHPALKRRAIVKSPSGTRTGNIQHPRLSTRGRVGRWKLNVEC